MYGFTTTLSGQPFEDVRSRVIDALKAEGFGVLSEIDVQKAMHEKLGAAMPPYRILGACNPPLAFSAISADPSVGLLLPCNVTVEWLAEGRTGVRLTDPEALLRYVASVSVRAAEVVGARAEEMRSAIARDTRDGAFYVAKSTGSFLARSG